MDSQVSSTYPLQSGRQTRYRGPARYSEEGGNALYVCQLDTLIIRHFHKIVKSILAFKRNARLHLLPKGRGFDGGVLKGCVKSILTAKAMRKH